MSHRPQESNLKGGEILHARIDTASAKDLADMGQAKHIADVLDKHYPGHLWAVHVDSLNGIATVKNLRLSGNWGFILKLPQIYSISEFDRQIMLMGGELLERYKLRAASFSQSQYEGILDSTGMPLQAQM